MEKRCYICGVVGFEELIATCMDCKSIFIHLYCMKTVHFVVPDDWMCEDCAEIPKQVVPKRVVKFVPEGEAIALASQSSPSKGKRHIASPKNACKTVEVPVKKADQHTNLDPLATPLTKRDVHACIPEKPSGLPTAEQNRFKKHTMPAQIVPESSKKQKSCIKDPVHARTTSSVSKPSPDLDKFKELFIPTHTASINSRRGFAQGDDPYKGTLNKNKNTRDQRLNGDDLYKGTLKANKNVRDQRLSGEKWKVDRFLPNHPASSATWKGCFTTSFFSAPISSYVTVWGYPPAKVAKKAYEFSKKMPDILPFEAIPRCSVWANMFHDGAPNKKDIGLYFFPNDDRSEKLYSGLVSHLEKQDIVLKSCICGIELLIFSSSFLDEESKEINQAFYLWGLFVDPVHSFKEPDQNQLPSETNTEASFQQSEKDVDMEIDNLGGVAIKQWASEAQVKPEKWDGEELASPPGFPVVIPSVVPSVPPGFEEAWRVKYKTIDELLQSENGR